MNKSFSPSSILEQIDADFPGLWARIEKAQPPGAPRPFPLVRESVARIYPPGTNHPCGYPLEYLVKAAAASERERREAMAMASGVDPKSIFVSYSAEALQAVAAWRTTKLHYQVDPDFWDELAETPLKGTPPSEIFERLPAKAFFISRKDDLLRHRAGDVRGFFVYVLPGILNVIPVTDTTISGKMEMRLGKESVEDALDRVCEEMKDASLRVINGHPDGTDEEKQKAVADLLKRWPVEEQSIRQNWHGILSNILYLCTERPDVEGRIPFAGKASRLGSRIHFPVPARETVVGVGVRLGAIFRKVAAKSSQNNGEASGRVMPPHIRRAHWHTYWVGKKGQQQPEVKWLTTILVNADSPEELDETVHKVLPC